MSASLIFASAESSRMTISVLLISSEKMTLAIRFLIEHDRMKSKPSVELWVGTMALLARYMWLALPTSTQRTGTLPVRRTFTMKRDLERAVPVAARRSLCNKALRGSANTSSMVENAKV
jgi:hypothetical protein